jgi:drug/metabolite transporter (DMT)-like permease
MVKSQASRVAVLPLKRNTEGVTTPVHSAVVRAEHQNWAVYSGLVFTMFVWGLAWPVGRLLATSLPPVSIAAIRYAIVVPVLFAILWFREGSFKIDRSWIPTLVVMGILNTTLYQIFFLYGVKYAAASDDSLVIGIGPVLIAVMASFVLKERLTGTKILGFASGLAGIITISILSPNTQVLNRPLGVTLVFGGATAYALYTVILRRFIAANRADNHGSQQSSLSILSWISLFGWFFLIPFSLLEAPWTYNWDAGSWLGILYLAILSTVIGYFLYIEGVSKIGAGRSAIFGNLVPVFGVLTSFLLLGENLSPWTAVSFLLILAGVLLVNKSRKSPHSLRTSP